MKKFVMMLTLMTSPMVMAGNIGDVPCNESPAAYLTEQYGCTDAESQSLQNNTTQVPESSDSGKLKWEICINGINLQGEQCQGDTWGQWNKPKQLTATGRDAMEVIRNSDILASGIDNQGQYRLIVTYKGQYRPAKGRTFSCTVSQDARRFECRSWSPTHRTNY